MELIPSIDILGGRVVRLHQGDYSAVTDFGDDAPASARAFADAGATRLHVVDLEGARSGVPCHVDEIRRILRATSLRVQVGGGIRTVSAAEQWFAAGAERVVLGTVAVREPAVAQEVCKRHPNGVVLALDARGDDVAVDGWQEASGKRLGDLAAKGEDWGAAAILYTDIARDGTGQGPAVERTKALQKQLSIPVIASGGVGSLAHLAALRDAGIRAAVCGRALYEGAIDLADGLRVAAGGDA